MANRLLNRSLRRHRLALVGVLLLGLGGCAWPGYRFVPPAHPWLPGGAPTPAAPAVTPPVPASATIPTLAARSLYLPPAISW